MINKPKILVVYTAMIPTAELVTGMAQGVIKKTEGQLRSKSSIRVRKKDIAWADIVLFVRGADIYMEKIGEAAYKAGRFCIMYLDDDLLNLPAEGMEAFKNACKGCLYWCHVLWSSNPHILEKYVQYMQVPKGVEENVFEPVKELLPVNEETEKIKIVYAGSPSHAPNLQSYVVPALNRICGKYPNVAVTFIGLQKKDLPDAAFQAEYIPWFQNIKKYKEYISQNRYHIGLAVIKDEEFYHCKYYNKFLEYCKMGIIGIYTDCDPYRFVVKDHVNGLLSENTPDAWERNIEEAVLNHSLRKQCVENAQKFLKEEFDLEKVLDRLLEKLPELNNYKADKSVQVQYGQKHFIIRIFDLIVSTRFGYWCCMRAADLWHLIKKGFGRPGH